MMQRKPLYTLKTASLVVEALGIGHLLAAALVCGSVGLELLGSNGFTLTTTLALLDIWFVLSVVLNVALIFWLFRASGNAAMIAPDPRWIKPWWTVIWWFVPAFNLWQPYRAMSQVWNTSVDHDMDLNGPAAPNVTTWWMLLLFGPVLAAVISGGDSPPLYLLALLLLLAAGSTASLMTIVRLVLAGQNEKSSRHSVSPMASAP
jgi:Domain of unknown function (DUF4328)